ncbi:2-Hydroxyacid oxidase 2-like [Lineus longissimus]|uniref:2-Hydroxyacid oxidase 2-like n=1 Tax=Lineus longissimus TaxID=88925 RepID=UPI002B4DBEBB
MASEKFSCIKDYEEYASVHLPKDSRLYTNSGADAEVTMRDNQAAFERWRLRPRYLVDVSFRATAGTILGHKVDFPVGISPTAFHRLAHPDGEAAVARAAQDMNTIYIMSTTATSSIEEIARVAPNGINWFQLYIPHDRTLAEDMILRAQKAGFKALVLTIDTPDTGKKRINVREPINWPKHLKLGNFREDQVDGISSSVTKGVPTGGQFTEKLTWKDLDWLKKITNLPIIVKGIMTGEDAELAVQYGVSAVFVSNHGGRQLDGCLATIDVLPEIVRAVRGRVEVYLDGGVRHGADVLKALALGATAVFMGRPIIWGLSYNGYQGVRQVLSIMKEEIHLALALTGCLTPQSIKSDQVVHVTQVHQSRL